MNALPILLAAAALLASALPVRAINSQAGTSGAQFLKLGAGSRAGAMGESYSAIVDDAYALYYNPAALTRLTRPELTASHSELFQGLSYETLGFAYPMGQSGTYSKQVIGFGIYNLSAGDIERRTEDTASPIGTFGSSDYSYNLSYARRISRGFSAGATGKFIYETIDSYNASAYALDVAGLYRPYPDAARPIDLSLVIKNLGSRPSYAGGVSDPLPSGFTVGAGSVILPKRLRVNLDISKYRDTNLILAAGGEFTHAFNPDLAAVLRAGYSTHHRENPGLSEITIGAGLNFHRASFDFAWVPFGQLGNTFRYSMLIRFGPKSAPPATK